MKTQNRFLTTMILMLTFALTNCRKDISVPNTEYDNLFGKWEWISTSGGFGGSIDNPTTTGYTQMIEFTQKGICIGYKNDKKQKKTNFTFGGNSMFLGKESWYLNFEDRGLFKDKNKNSQLVTLIGKDTLILNEMGVSEGYISKYVKK